MNDEIKSPVERVVGERAEWHKPEVRKLDASAAEGASGAPAGDNAYLFLSRLFAGWALFGLDGLGI
ncbi:MAG: hypothetical protein WDN08_07775 [Rhizomicrobium sp.]